MRVNIYASFTDTEMAREAVGALLDHGVLEQDISLVLPVAPNRDPTIEAERAEETIGSAESGITTTTSTDAAVGATKGAFVGFGVGALAAAAAILIPGVGLVVGGGALAIALAGAAGATIAGTIAGGITGYLKDQGVPSDEIVHFTNVYEGGGAILTVTTPSGGNGPDKVESILGKYDSASVRVWQAAPHDIVEGIPVAPAGPVIVERATIVEPGGAAKQVVIVEPVVPSTAAVVVDQSPDTEPVVVVKSAMSEVPPVIVEPAPTTRST